MKTLWDPASSSSMLSFARFVVGTIDRTDGGGESGDERVCFNKRVQNRKEKRHAAVVPVSIGTHHTLWRIHLHERPLFHGVGGEGDDDDDYDEKTKKKKMRILKKGRKPIRGEKMGGVS
ncbi:hypothetical protein GCK72_001054 [Caenorhabditis remanei]|uniref:Uncharacterized protein n=1 Tax=Caenorhabditis remanei TaxID=31234 RepID=A0A6A5HNK5_CAERE|nr:hypothetical protein GCK72_001054 [Caenorhabditis remanei]KAF1769239.1 hypothetical protein GCK72_001054 [Caenorhabditis remanei]